MATTTGVRSGSTGQWEQVFRGKESGVRLTCRRSFGVVRERAEDLGPYVSAKDLPSIFPLWTSSEWMSHLVWANPRLKLLRSEKPQFQSGVTQAEIFVIRSK